MTKLKWDASGEKVFETGVDQGVLFIPSDGVYSSGVAWNGLTSVTESPSGAESNKQYADNGVYADLTSAEEFGGTIEAFTFPDEFSQFDGTATPSPGVQVGQQSRKPFGLSYRTLVGNDTDGNDHGYKIHLAYGCKAAPSEKQFSTVNDSPEALNFSWTFTTTPVAVTGLKPTALLTIDSTKVDATALASLEAIIYGDGSNDARLPLPDEVIDLFGGSVTVVNMNTSTNQPSYSAGTHVVTLPAVTGVQWIYNGTEVASGAQPALTAGQVADIEATPQDNYTLEGDTDWSFAY